MNELDNIIRDYLKATDTDYAIMINGKWGCGKSYYIEHTLDEIIGSIPIPKEENMKRQAKQSRRPMRRRTYLYMGLRT